MEESTSNEYEDYQLALRELHEAVHEVYEQAKTTERAMNKAVNGSNIRSILTMFKDDYLVRELLGKRK